MQDAQGARCVFFACPAQGELDVCWMDTHIGHCSNGALASQGDCGAFAAYCSTAGGQAAHCASAFCVASPADVPVPHDVCLPDGQLYSCDGAGGITKLGCGAATRCVSTPSAHCVPTGCPASGDVHVCQTDTVVAHCVNGQVTDTGDCGIFAAMCSTAGGVDAHCVSDFCVPSAQDVPVAHDICFLDGDRYHCDGAGGIAKIACPAGEKCSTYPSLHCTASTGCPANVNDVWICADGHTRGHCYGGGLGGAEPCPAQTTCVTVSGEGRCVPDACASVPGQSKDLCLPDGKRGHCNPDGTLSSEACAAGTSCLDGACVGLDAGAPESDASEPALTPDATSAIKGDAGVKPGADGGQIALPVAGCGCGAAGGLVAAPWLMALAAFARRRRRG